MPESNDGLPLPPPPRVTVAAPRPASSSQPRADLDAYMVRGALDKVTDQSRAGSGPWGRLVTPGSAPDRSVLAGAPDGPGVLFNPVDSPLKRMRTGSVPERIGGVIDHLMSPVTAMTEDIEAANMDEVQKKFADDHGERSPGRELPRMGAAMGNLSLNLEKLSDLAASFPLGQTQAMTTLMEKKAAVGNLTKVNLKEALDNAAPEDRPRLEAMKRDFDGWIDQRDARVESEQPEVNELAEGIQALSKTLNAQMNPLAEARQAAFNLRVGTTLNASPAASIMARSVRQYLMGAKGAVLGALSRPRDGS